MAAYRGSLEVAEEAGTGLNIDGGFPAWLGRQPPRPKSGKIFQERSIDGQPLKRDRHWSSSDPSPPNNSTPLGGKPHKRGKIVLTPFA